MLRVIAEAKPRWVIAENVAGFINMGLDQCVSDMEGEGYEVRAVVIPACAVGAPHRRDRVWIVGHANQFNGNSSGSCSGEISQLKEAEIQRRNAADASNKRLQGSERPGTHEEIPAAHGSTTQRNSAWDEPWIEAASRFCKFHDGLPRRVDRSSRLKALGNAIVPQVAAQIMEAIKRIEYT